MKILEKTNQFMDPNLCSTNFSKITWLLRMKLNQASNLFEENYKCLLKIHNFFFIPRTLLVRLELFYQNEDV